MKFLDKKTNILKHFLKMKVKDFIKIPHIPYCHCDCNKEENDNYNLELFRTLWMKQLNGELVCYGNSYLDKFINSLIQILTVQPSEFTFETVEKNENMELVFMFIFKYHATKVYVLDKDKKPITKLCLCELIQHLHSIISSSSLSFYS